MPVALQTLGIDQWSVEDRLTLAQEIWDSVADEMAQQPLTDAQHDELMRRVEDADANPDDAIPWETIKAEALARSRP